MATVKGKKADVSSVSLSSIALTKETVVLQFYCVYMQDDLTCKNKHLFPSLSFSMLLKRIHTNMRVVPRLHYTGRKGRPA